MDGWMDGSLSILSLRLVPVYVAQSAEDCSGNQRVLQLNPHHKASHLQGKETPFLWLTGEPSPAACSLPPPFLSSTQVPLHISQPLGPSHHIILWLLDLNPSLDHVILGLGAFSVVFSDTGSCHVPQAINSVFLAARASRQEIRCQLYYHGLKDTPLRVKIYECSISMLRCNLI